MDLSLGENDGPRPKDGKDKKANGTQPMELKKILKNFQQRNLCEPSIVSDSYQKMRRWRPLVEP